MAEPVAVKLSEESIKALTDTFTKSVSQGLQQGMGDILTAPLRKLASLLPETASSLKKIFAEAAQPMLTAAKEWVISFDKGIASKLWKAGPPSIEKLLGGTQSVGGKAVFGPGFAGAGTSAAGDAAAIAAPGSPAGALTRLGAALGPVALGAAAVVGLGVAAVGAVKAIQGMGEKAIEAKRGLAELSPGMAAAFATKDVAEEMRGMRQGENQAGSLQELVDAQQDLKDALEPIQNMMAQITNRFLTKLTELATWMVSLLNQILKPVIEIAVRLGVMDEEKEPPGENMIQWSNRVANEIAAERKNLDPRKFQFQF